MSATISQLIREALEGQNKTIADFAKEIRKSRSYVSSIINNLKKAPKEQVEYMLLKLGYSKDDSERLAEEYENFHNIYKNEKDLRFISLKQKYKLGFFVNDDARPSLTEEDHKSKIIIQFVHNDIALRIGIAISGYRGAMQSGIKIHKPSLNSSGGKGEEIEDFGDIFQILEIKPKLFLQLLNFEMVRTVNIERLNVANGELLISELYLEERQESFKNTDSLVSEFSKENERNKVTELNKKSPEAAYKQGITDVFNFLIKDFNARKKMLGQIVEVYPKGYKVIEEYFKKYL